MSADAISALVRHLVGTMVDEPDQIAIFRSENHRGLVLELRVAPNDLPRVLGRGGRTIQSMRAAVGALADRLSTPVDLRVLEEDEDPQGQTG
jgi:predicted RNA-binding protein YlqC (UPF0109 family)